MVSVTRNDEDDMMNCVDMILMIIMILDELILVLMFVICILNGDPSNLRIWLSTLFLTPLRWILLVLNT